jgi:hypothetical protein
MLQQMFGAVHFQSRLIVGCSKPKDLLLNPDTKNKLAFILLDVRGARIMKGAQVGRIAKRNSA